MATVRELEEAQLEEAQALLGSSKAESGPGFGARAAALLGTSLLVAAGGCASWWHGMRFSTEGIIEDRAIPGEVLGCSADGQDCRATQCCTNPESTCFRKNDHWASCNATCSHNYKWVNNEWTSMGCEHVWDCHALSCAQDGQDCLSSRCCAREGSRCFQKNDHWASCNATCSNNVIWVDNAWVDMGYHVWDCNELLPVAEVCDTSECNGGSGEQVQYCREAKMRDCCLDEACRGAQGEEVALCRRDHLNQCCEGLTEHCKNVDDFFPTQQPINPGDNPCDLSSCAGCSGSYECQICYEEKEVNCCVDAACGDAQGEQLSLCRRDHLVKCCEGKVEYCKGSVPIPQPINPGLPTQQPINPCDLSACSGCVDSYQCQVCYEEKEVDCCVDEACRGAQGEQVALCRRDQLATCCEGKMDLEHCKGSLPVPQPINPDNNQCDLSACSTCVGGYQCQVCFEEREVDCCVDQACRGAQGEQVASCRRDELAKCCQGKMDLERCKGSLPVPQPINPGGTICSADGEDCRSTQCCTNPGSTCFRKNDHWASCNATCSHNYMWVSYEWVNIGAGHIWDCHPLSCTEDGQNCMSSRCCAREGSRCFQKNDHWASCNATCSNNFMWENNQWVDKGYHIWDCQELLPGAELCDTSECNRASGEQVQHCREATMRDCCLDDACQGAQGEQVALCRRDHLDHCCEGKTEQCKNVDDFLPTQQPIIPDDKQCDLSSCAGCSGSYECQICYEEKEVNCCVDAACRGAQGEQLSLCHRDHLAKCCEGKAEYCKGSVPIPQPINPCDLSACSGCVGSYQCQICYEEKEVNCCVDGACRGAQGEQLSLCHRDHLAKCCEGKAEYCKGSPTQQPINPDSTQCDLSSCSSCVDGYQCQVCFEEKKVDCCVDEACSFAQSEQGSWCRSSVLFKCCEGKMDLERCKGSLPVPQPIDPDSSQCDLSACSTCVGGYQCEDCYEKTKVECCVDAACRGAQGEQVALCRRDSFAKCCEGKVNLGYCKGSVPMDCDISACNGASGEQRQHCVEELQRDCCLREACKHAQGEQVAPCYDRNLQRCCEGRSPKCIAGHHSTAQAAFR